MNDIKAGYFEWLYVTVCGCCPDYHRLLYFLHQTEFTYTVPLDGNRYEDGVDLRYRYGYEHNIEQSIIATELDIYPCSVLEMMVALVCRCEEHIMSNSELGDRTGKWFMFMLRSLGLDTMTDDNFQEDKASYILAKFLNREYEPDGDGGLFWIRGTNKDMRKPQIWDQAMWYLNTQL